VGNEQMDLKIVSNKIQEQNKITKIYMKLFLKIYILVKKTTKVKRNSLEYLQKKNPVYRKGRDGSPSTRSTRQMTFRLCGAKVLEYAPLLVESFPKTPRTRSEAFRFVGSHNYKTKQTTFLHR